MLVMMSFFMLGDSQKHTVISDISRLLYPHYMTKIVRTLTCIHEMSPTGIDPIMPVCL